MEVGGRAKQDARADAYMEVDGRAKQDARADAYMEVGGRAKQKAIAGHGNQKVPLAGHDGISHNPMFNCGFRFKGEPSIMIIVLDEFSLVVNIADRAKMQINLPISCKNELIFRSI